LYLGIVVRWRTNPVTVGVFFISDAVLTTHHRYRGGFMTAPGGG
jgi:hypothetical protein